MYFIAALQFGTAFVLATIFWAGAIIEKLRATPKPYRRLTETAPPQTA